MLTRRGFLRLAAQGWLFALVLGGYATGVEAMGFPHVTRYAFTPPRWTPGLKLKVAMISDIHACEPWMNAARIRSICEAVNALDADIVFLVGDFESSMDFVTAYLPSEQIAEALSGLKAPLGVHAVMGNHDCWADEAFQADPSRPVRMGEALKAVGIQVYWNEAVRLEKDGMPFWLAGLADQMALYPSRRRNRPDPISLADPQATLARVTDEAPVLMLAHEPHVFHTGSDRVSLTLSGHTHGGQVNLFGWAPMPDNPDDRRYLYGHMQKDGRHIVVSRGLGCSALPIRFGAWPEIVSLELG